MEDSRLAEMLKHENESWERIFRAELAKRESERTDFSSFWWELYYTEIKKFVLQQIADYQDPRILEAGSGSGKASILLGGEYKRTLVDISEGALEYAKYLAKRFGAENVSFLKWNIFNMPFADESFDFVWNIGVAEHYDDRGIIDIFTEMIRITERGGTVFVGIPNFKSLPIRKASILRNKFLKFIPGYRLDSEKSYSEEQMTDFLKLGATKAHRIISNVQIRYFGSPLFIESPKWLILTLGRFMEWFAPKSRFLMCIVCRVE
ncbi:MAG: class I SAM-dependent methyltransferase [Candidatus Paceibacterota bacterium]